MTEELKDISKRLKRVEARCCCQTTPFAVVPFTSGDDGLIEYLDTTYSTAKEGDKMIFFYEDGEFAVLEYDGNTWNNTLWFSSLESRFGDHYQFYITVLTQELTDDPAFSLNYNSGIIDIPLSWVRSGIGTYTFTATANVFDINRTALFITQNVSTGTAIIKRTSDTVITIETRDNAGVLSDDILSGTTVEIKIFD